MSDWAERPKTRAGYARRAPAFTWSSTPLFLMNRRRDEQHLGMAGMWSPTFLDLAAPNRIRVGFLGS